MGEHVVKLPDVGEGVAEAELVEWHVAAGDLVREDDVLVAVMTDKATVEIPAPMDGKVLKLGGDVGETLAVGSELIRLEVEGEGGESAATPIESEPEKPPEAPPEPPPEPTPQPKVSEPERPQAPALRPPASSGPPRPLGEKPLAAPSVRKRARDAGADLRQIVGTGPAGRILHEDLDAFLSQGPAQGGRPGRAADTSVVEVKMAGLRRRIAAKMSLSKTRIPHYAIVEEVDMSALETLRSELNADKRNDRPRLTVLPFVMKAMVKALKRHPGINSRYDDDAEIIRQYGGVHVGVATQTANGLMVPVVSHVEARDIWDCASEVARLADAARDGSAKSNELSGSTITLTSLGPLGAIATTPVINHPEVAIVGVNKIAIRPHWDGAQFVPRKMMNISCSFDHRIVDGYDAAEFVRDLKTHLESPAMIFVED